METPSAPNRGLRIAKIIFYVLVIGLAVAIIAQYFTGGDGTGESFVDRILPGKTHNVQIRYVPKEFEFNMDEQEALRIISNPQRYRKEFSEMIYDLNLSMLYHVADRMSLPDSLRSRIQTRYDEVHPNIRQLYYNDILKLRDSTTRLYDTWYKADATDALAVLREVASKYTCFLVNSVVVELLESSGGKLTAKGREVLSPCGIALNEALNPVMDRMKERAAILDFQRSKGLMEERVEKVIAELATMEVRDKKGLSRQLSTKVLGYNVSKTDVEMSAISILKVGFRLDEYFDVALSSSQKTVIITLPEPQVLSHEVYPKIDKLDIGWLREIQDKDFNSNFNLLRKEFRNDALQSDIMSKAKVQAEDLMHTMFDPVVAHFNRSYRVEVRFREGQSAFDDAAEQALYDDWSN